MHVGASRLHLARSVAAVVEDVAGVGGAGVQLLHHLLKDRPMNLLLADRGHRDCDAQEIFHRIRGV
jgi:hypothetical protein